MSTIIDTLTALGTNAWLRLTAETVAAAVVVVYLDYCAAAFLPDWRRGGVPSKSRTSFPNEPSPKAQRS